MPNLQPGVGPSPKAVRDFLKKWLTNPDTYPDEFISWVRNQVVNSGNLFDVAQSPEIRKAILGQLSGLAGRKIAFGHAFGASDASGQLTVTFASAFPSAPNVVAIPANASHAIILRVQSVTTTGFKPTFFDTAGVLDVGQSQDCFWIAIG